MKAKTKKTKRSIRPGGGKKGGEPQLVEFTPDRTLPLTVNGKTIEVHAGAKTRVPPEYHAVYEQSR